MTADSPTLPWLQNAQAAAGHLAFPFRSRTWRGHVGNWQGVGTGSSIDFQDHRPYLPGDDPRYMDWRAYARTGHYTMKLYREETSPRLDVAVDTSRSMVLGAAKTQRVLELLFFSMENARRSSAALQLWAVSGAEVRPLLPEEAVRAGAELFTAQPGAPDLRRVPWRPGSLRVLLSDLLFAGAPDGCLPPLTHQRGTGLVLAPYAAEESAPGWSGNLELVDCETGSGALRQVSAPVLARYGAAYARHFSLWREAGRKLGVPVARVAAEPGLVAALQAEALPVGAVELW